MSDSDTLGASVETTSAPETQSSETVTSTADERTPGAISPALVAKYFGDGKGRVPDAAPANDSAPPAPANTNAAPAPKDPAPSAESIAEWQRAHLQKADIEKREAALAEREAQDLRRRGDYAERFADNPWETMRELVKASLGDGATDDEVDREFGHQLYALNVKHTGVEIDTKNPAYDLRRLDRELRLQKAQTRKAQELARVERETLAKAKADQESAEARRRDIEEGRKIVLDQYKPLADKYEWLSVAHENPAELVAGYVVDTYERTGNVIQTKDAADALEEHFSKMYRPIRERITSKISPPKASDHQGAPPVPRPRSLTNADASESSRPVELKMDEFGNPPPLEDRLRNSLERFMAKQQRPA